MATIGIACGGTGGHLFPGLAVADELIEYGHDVRLYVSKKKIDRIALKNHSHITATEMSSIGWPGISPRMIPFGVNLIKAYFECIAEIKKYKINAVLGMGGFSSAPLLWASKSIGLPAFLHESNAYPGKVTRLLATSVDRVLIGMEKCAEYLSKDIAQHVGTPVRKTLTKNDKAESIRSFGLDPLRKTLLVMGGSQGANGVNQMVVNTLPLITDLKDTWQFIHITGSEDQTILEMNYKKHGFKATVCNFCHEMEMFYSAGDLIVSRSGASSLTEISHYELASILIPYPLAAEDHQSINASVYTAKSASEVIHQSSKANKELASFIRKVTCEPDLLNRMAANAKSIIVDDAEKRIAQEILSKIE